MWQEIAKNNTYNPFKPGIQLHLVTADHNLLKEECQKYDMSKNVINRQHRMPFPYSFFRKFVVKKGFAKY
jgi:hypothetical protein